MSGCGIVQRVPVHMVYFTLDPERSWLQGEYHFTPALGGHYIFADQGTACDLFRDM